jgi:hypothetical protein
MKKIHWMMLTLSFIFPLILAHAQTQPPPGGSNNPNSPEQTTNDKFFDKKEYKDLQQYTPDDVVNLDEKDMSHGSS